jgi:hypothetical protein
VQDGKIYITYLEWSELVFPDEAQKLSVRRRLAELAIGTRGIELEQISMENPVLCMLLTE